MVGVLPLLASCMFIVPTDKRTVTNEADRWDPPRPVGRPELALEREVSGTALVLRGIWRRTCEQRGEHTTTSRVERTSRFTIWACSNDDGCMWMIFLGVMAAPVTLLVSGVVTAIDVKSTDDRMEQTVNALPVHTAPCDLPAKGWNLIVTAAGREPIAVTTDEQGTAHVDLGDAQLARTATVVPATPR